MPDPDRMQDALERIVEWGVAYPVTMFPEPDWPKVARVLHAAGLSLDSVTAANMRHIVTEIAKIARKGLE